MTIEDFKKILKSNAFKSTNRLQQTHYLQFTELHVFKDGKYLCDYNIAKGVNDFKMTFSNLQFPFFTDDFINILLIVDNVRVQININTLIFTGVYNIILESQKKV